MSESIPPLEELDRIYSSVLDQLLFPPHVKEQLLASQPPEKKWQQVLLHKTTTENKETAFNPSQNAQKDSQI